MAQINPRTFADAKQFGDSVYELILTNWGNRGLAQDPNNGSIMYPPIRPNTNGSIPLPPLAGEQQFLLPRIPSLFGIAIAPRSQIDRCILYTPALPQVPSTDTKVQIPSGGAVAIDEGFINRGGILETEQILSPHTPLIGMQLGPIIVRAVREHWFSDAYIEVGSVAPAVSPFGTALGLNNDNIPVFNNPELRLLLYLTSKGVLPPTRRSPFNINSFFALPAAAGFVLQSVVPVMGRSYVTVEVFNFDTLNPINVRISGTIHGVASAPGPVFAIQNDTEIAITTVAVAARSSLSFTVNTPGISFLLLKIEAVNGAVGRWQITAFD